MSGSHSTDKAGWFFSWCGGKWKEKRVADRLRASSRRNSYPGGWRSKYCPIRHCFAIDLTEKPWRDRRGQSDTAQASYLTNPYHLNIVLSRSYSPETLSASIRSAESNWSEVCGAGWLMGVINGGQLESHWCVAFLGCGFSCSRENRRTAESRTESLSTVTARSAARPEWRPTSPAGKSSYVLRSRRSPAQ